MGFSAPRHHHSLADYLALEAASNVKHEYYEGEIYAMSGGTPEHAALAAAVCAALVTQLQGGPCRVFSSDLRVRVLATGLATYPDVTVVCGSLERDPDSSVTVTNPKVIVEVTSDGTEAYDRTHKLEHYQSISSLCAVVVVSHRGPRLDLWNRPAGGAWSQRSFGPGQQVELEAIGARLAVDALYAAVRDL